MPSHVTSPWNKTIINVKTALLKERILVYFTVNQNHLEAILHSHDGLVLFGPRSQQIPSAQEQLLESLAQSQGWSYGPLPCALGCVGGGPALLITPCDQTQSTKNTDPTRESEITRGHRSGHLVPQSQLWKTVVLTREHRCLPASNGLRRLRGEWVRTLGSQCQLVSIVQQTAAPHKGLGRRDTAPTKSKAKVLAPAPRTSSTEGESWDTSGTDSASRVLLANAFVGLPWWLRGKESACQHRRHGFDPWSGKIPHACITMRVCHNYWVWALEPGSCNYRSLHVPEPVLHSKRSHRHGKPAHQQRPTHHSKKIRKKQKKPNLIYL